MELFFHAAEAGEIPDCGVGPGNRGTPAHTMRTAFGEECSFGISVRTSQHHSEPHVHDQEQLNYIVEGEMWTFIRDRGYLLKKGDILRIPRNEIHWSWVKTDEPCLCVEAFSPPMSNGQPLFDQGEAPKVRESDGTYPVDLAAIGLDLDEIEARPPVNRPNE
jgi:mannose-6-phosphate isomerase-like protein (cupin superfamily)